MCKKTFFVNISLFIGSALCLLLLFPLRNGILIGSSSAQRNISSVLIVLSALILLACVCLKLKELTTIQKCVYSGLSIIAVLLSIYSAYVLITMEVSHEGFHQMEKYFKSATIIALCVMALSTAVTLYFFIKTAKKMTNKA